MSTTATSISTTSTISDIVSRVSSKFSQAQESGDLFFFPSTIHKHSESGVEFEIRLCPALQKKPHLPTPHFEVPPPDKKDSDPFSPPYIPGLLVGELTEGEEGEELEEYAVLLNKFAVVENHFLLVTKKYESQSAPLTPTDLVLAYKILAEAKKTGKTFFGFYNCGDNSGASQPHKHLQFVPSPGDDAPPVEVLARSARIESPDKPFSLQTLPYANHVYRFPSSLPHASASTLESTLSTAFISLLDLVISTLRHDKASPPGRPSYNVIITLEHLHLIPRVKENYVLQETGDEISVNSLGYAGMMLVKSEEELKRVVKEGLGNILRDVGAGSVHDLQVEGTSAEHTNSQISESTILGSPDPLTVSKPNSKPSQTRLFLNIIALLIIFTSDHEQTSAVSAQILPPRQDDGRIDTNLYITYNRHLPEPDQSAQVELFVRQVFESLQDVCVDTKRASDADNTAQASQINGRIVDAIAKMAYRLSWPIISSYLSKQRKIITASRKRFQKDRSGFLTPEERQQLVEVFSVLDGLYPEEGHSEDIEPMCELASRHYDSWIKAGYMSAEGQNCNRIEEGCDYEEYDYDEDDDNYDCSRDDEWRRAVSPDTKLFQKMESFMFNNSRPIESPLEEWVHRLTAVHARCKRLVQLVTKSKRLGRIIKGSISVKVLPPPPSFTGGPLSIPFGQRSPAISKTRERFKDMPIKFKTDDGIYVETTLGDKACDERTEAFIKHNIDRLREYPALYDVQQETISFTSSYIPPELSMLYHIHTQGLVVYDYIATSENVCAQSDFILREYARLYHGQYYRTSGQHRDITQGWVFPDFGDERMAEICTNLVLELQTKLASWLVPFITSFTRKRPTSEEIEEMWKRYAESYPDAERIKLHMLKGYGERGIELY